MFADRINAKMGEGQLGELPPLELNILTWDVSCMLNLLTQRSILKLKLFGYTSGTFGQVLECWDRERKEMVAIKIIRGIKKYRDAAMIEIGMLEQLGKYEKSRSRWVLWFTFPFPLSNCWSICVLYLRNIACIYKLVYFAVVFKFGTGLTIVTISVL